MPDHYYTAEPESASRPVECVVQIAGRELRFLTDAGVFSRGELDPGSVLLIRSVGSLAGEVLDLGCGWGAIGIALAVMNPAARFTFSDINARAVELARGNIARNGIANAQAIQSDGFTALSGAFDHIVSNPPIRIGKGPLYALFDAAFERLNPGGSLTIVIRKQQGAPSAVKHFEGLFGNAEVIARSGGYWIIQSRKKVES